MIGGLYSFAYALRKGRNAHKVAYISSEMEGVSDGVGVPLEPLHRMSVAGVPKGVSVDSEDMTFREDGAIDYGSRKHVQPMGAKDNLYSGKCELCGDSVRPGDGWRYKPQENAAWILRHKVCPQDETKTQPEPLHSGAKTTSPTIHKSTETKPLIPSKTPEARVSGTTPQTPHVPQVIVRPLVEYSQTRCQTPPQRRR